MNLLANRRVDAFIDVVKEKNIEHVIVQTDINVFDIDQYEKLIHKLLREHPDIDGIFASSDIKAAHAIKVCNQLKKKVPEEIKIVGYDDVRIASLIVPQITTIRQPIEEISKLAIDLLVKQIEGQKVSGQNILSVTLIERETT